MNPDHLREFVRRERERKTEFDRRHWASAARESDGQATLLAGHALLEHARLVRPDFPGEAYAKSDFEHHLRLKGLIDRAAEAFSRR